MSMCISTMKSVSIRPATSANANRALGSQCGFLRSNRRVHVLASSTQTMLDVEKMSPLGDRILVKPKPAEQQTAGGILLTTSSTPKMDDALIGSVVAVGEEVDCGVDVGDQIMYTKYGSSDIEGPDGELSFVAQASILAKIS